MQLRRAAIASKCLVDIFFFSDPELLLFSLSPSLLTSHPAAFFIYPVSEAANKRYARLSGIEDNTIAYDSYELEAMSSVY